MGKDTLKRKYNDIELSAMLGEHVVGNLKPGATCPNMHCGWNSICSGHPICIETCAYFFRGNLDEPDGPCDHAVAWFDTTYSRRWSVDRLAVELVKEFT